MPVLIFRTKQTDFSCKKKFSKSTLWKIEELSSLLKANHCENLHNYHYPKEITQNKDGSITNTTRCVKIGATAEIDNALRYLAAICAARTKLPINRYVLLKKITYLF